MADLDRSLALHEDSPDRRNEREGSRESDQDDRDRRRRGSSYERDLKRESRRYSPYPSKEERNSRGTAGSGDKAENRIFISNLRYTVKWQDLKDHFKKVGDVAFAEIMEDECGKSRGCGVVEFRNSQDAEKAIKEIDGTEWFGRTIHCREDRVARTGTGRSGSGGRTGSSGHRYSGSGSSNPPGLMALGNVGMLQGINYTNDPASCTVFVSNLDYKISWQKLKDTFRMAGNVLRAEISEDEQKKSKGYGTVQFETAMEALNAINMFHGQVLHDRAMSVRLDRNAAVAKQLNNMGMSSQMPNRGGGDSSGVGMGGPPTAAAGLNPMAIMQLLQSLQNLQGLVQLAGLAGASGGLGSSTPGASSDAGGFNPMSLQNMGGLGALASLSGASGMMGGAGGFPGLGFGSSSGGSGSTGLSGGMSSPPSYSQTSGAVSGRQVFVRNLPWRFTWQNLKDKFRDAGKVVRADILTEDNGRSKGCGIVVFDRAEDANNAISLFNGATVEGRELDVRLDKFA